MQMRFRGYFWSRGTGSDAILDILAQKVSVAGSRFPVKYESFTDLIHSKVHVYVRSVVRGHVGVIVMRVHMVFSEK